MTERLQKMIETNSIMNMLFYGKVGTGKTSAARLFEDFADLYALGRGRGEATSLVPRRNGSS